MRPLELTSKDPALMAIVPAKIEPESRSSFACTLKAPSVSSKALSVDPPSISSTVAFTRADVVHVTLLDSTIASCPCAVKVDVLFHDADERVALTTATADAAVTVE